MALMEEKSDAYKEQVGHLKQSLPGVANAYHEFTGQCFQAGALDVKTKQLIALGIGLFANIMCRRPNPRGKRSGDYGNDRGGRSCRQRTCHEPGRIEGAKRIALKEAEAYK